MKNTTILKTRSAVLIRVVAFSLFSCIALTTQAQLVWQGQTAGWGNSGNWWNELNEPTAPTADTDLNLGNNGSQTSTRGPAIGRDVTFSRTSGPFVMQSTGRGATFTFRSWHSETGTAQMIFRSEQASPLGRDSQLIITQDLTVDSRISLGDPSQTSTRSDAAIYDASVGGTTYINTGGVLEISRVNNAQQSNDGRVFLGDIVMDGGIFRLTAGSGNSGTDTSVENIAYARSLSGVGTIHADKDDSLGALTIEGPGSGSFGGTIQDGASGAKVRLVRSGTGTQTLTGNNTYSGSTTITGGTLVLDYSDSDADRILNSSHLILGGGTLAIDGGDHTQAVGDTTIAVGSSAVSRPGGNSTLNLGAITRESGGTVDFSADGIATTTTANTNGDILGNFATVGGSSWAVSASDGVNPGSITALDVYASNYATADAQANFDATSSGTFSASEIRSLRFNTATDTIAEINGAFTLGSGGILVTAAVGSNTTTLTGGTSLSTGSGHDLAIIQNNSSGLFLIESTIVGTNDLTKSGSGTAVLSGQNTLSGTIWLNEGTLQAGTTGVDNNSGAFGNGATVTIANRSGVVLDLNNHDNTIGALVGGGPQGGNVSLGSGTLSIGNNHTGKAEYLGSISGSGGLTKLGEGTQLLSGTNTYSGKTTVAGGTLHFTSRHALYDSNTSQWNTTNIDVHAGSVLAISIGEGGEVADELFTMNNLTTLLGLGAAEGGFRDGSYIGIDTSKAMVLAGTGNQGVRYTPVISDPNGNSIGIVKMGEGTALRNMLTLRGNNTYTGGTILVGGYLAAGHNSAFGTGTVMVTGDQFARLHTRDMTTNYTIANDIAYANTHASSAVERFVASSTQFNTGTTGTFSSAFDNGIETRIELLDGLASVDRNLIMRFTPDHTASNDFMRQSDVFQFSFSGAGTDIFVLQLGIAEINPGYFLGWFDSDSGEWVNAVDGNSSTGGSAIAGFAGSYLDSTATASAEFLGSWGFDTANNSVWAILDHNSDFAIIPEPGTVSLLAALAATLFVVIRRRR